MIQDSFTQRREEHETIISIHFPWMEKQDACVFTGQNKTLITFYIFWLPGAAYSGMLFPSACSLWVPLKAAGEAAAKPVHTIKSVSVTQTLTRAVERQLEPR